MACTSEFLRYSGYAQGPAHKIPPYSPSAASTTSSTSSTAFSIDAPSSQSSVSCTSNDEWSTSVCQTENQNANILSGHLRKSTIRSTDDVVLSSVPSSTSRSQLSSSVAPCSRQNPRRTQRLNSHESQDGTKINSCPLPPPTLIRQSERKDNFVESLVDTSTQMIEAIWPLSVSSCGGESAPGVKRQQLLNLRTFVQEVLKRSKTSYSTLQVALYYLILIQSCLPRHDLTMEQTEDSSTYRAMQCGRRMFLAALILASKYLQDRNFSTRAWSKISGLRTCEINSNEGAFLLAVGWKLHVPKQIFDKWENIVMNYSPAARVNSHPRSLPAGLLSWKAFVRTLKPELDVAFPFEIDEDSGYGSATSDSGSDTESASSDTDSESAAFRTRSTLEMAPPPLPVQDDLDICSDSSDPTPTNSFAVPRTLEPTPRDMNGQATVIPQMPRMGLLPTPQLTPQIGTFSTPAANATGFCFKKPNEPSMASAIAHMRAKELAKYNDSPCEWGSMKLPQPFPTSARRSSLARSISSISSPESMISDRSSRSSRSSSISSNASSNCALPQPRLSVEATRRCANMKLCRLKEESGQSTPTQQSKQEVDDMSWVDFMETQCPGYRKPITNNLDQIMKRLPSNRAVAQVYDQGHLSSRPVLSGNAAESASTHEAAAALREMALNRQQLTPSPARALQQQPISRPLSARSLKRSRSTSVDGSGPSLQCLVRQQLSEVNEDDSNVSPDEHIADSFLLRKENQHPKRCRQGPQPKTMVSHHGNGKLAKPSISRESMSRKRTCAGSQRGARAEARMYERSITGVQQPGLWDDGMVL